jgi:hypothetical protein
MASRPYTIAVVARAPPIRNPPAMSLGTWSPPSSSTDVTYATQAIASGSTRGQSDATIAATITERVVWPLGYVPLILTPKTTAE